MRIPRHAPRIAHPLRLAACPLPLTLLAVVLATALLGCGGKPAFRLQAEEEELVEKIRDTLLASVEAEKSAVLATSDEESLQMAQESRRLGVKIDGLVDELRGRVTEDGRPAVQEGLDAFVERWRELKKVDDRLLGLAVANTNLKAARLSARAGLAGIERFVTALAEMERATADPETIRTLSAASVAAFHEQALLAIHIPSADDAEMTRLEQQMASLAASVDRTLATLTANDAAPEAARAAAVGAWEEHRRIVAEVVRLSRENSNVRSFDVSTHEKRDVTRQCLDALDALEAAVGAGPKPAR